jgi:hypothetical protein
VKNIFLLPNRIAEEELFALGSKYITLDDYPDGTMTEMGDLNKDIITKQLGAIDVAICLSLIEEAFVTPMLKLCLK